MNPLIRVHALTRMPHSLRHWSLLFRHAIHVVAKSMIILLLPICFPIEEGLSGDGQAAAPNSKQRR
jgi:hypothetical protein